MQNNYILRQNNNRLICFFRTDKACISYKIHENNSWNEENILMENSLEKFTVTIGKDNNIYIFCQNLDGDIVLCTSDISLKNWSKKTILKNQSQNIHSILFYPIIKSRGLSLIYSIPQSDNSMQLVRQSLDETGLWGQPEYIDKLLNNKNNMFLVQNISKEHLIVYYQCKMSENNIGYREITSNEFSEFNPIHLTAYQITDYSFLTTNESIHALYLVKSMFSNQLIYRKKSIDEFSKPTVIWEGPRIENILISIIKGIIYITFKYKGQLLVSTSKNDGLNFSRPEIYKIKYSHNLKKSIYLSEPEMKKEEFYIREVYVNADNPWEIEFIPNIYEDFYKKFEVEEDIKAEEDEIKKQSNEVFDSNMKTIHNLNSIIKKLEEDNKNKDEQIKYMTNIINNLKFEKEDINIEKININNRHAKELADLKNKLQELENYKNNLTLKTENHENENKYNKNLENEEIKEFKESEKYSVKNIEDNNEEKESEKKPEDDRIITIQSRDPSVLIPYKR